MAEQDTNEERVVLLVRLKRITALACLLITGVEVLDAADRLARREGAMPTMQ
jgi:hypothetical protein